MSSSTLLLDSSSVLSPAVVDRVVSLYLASVPPPVLVNELIDVVAKCVESAIPINMAPENQHSLLPSLLTFVEQVTYAGKALPVTLVCAIVYLDRMRMKLPIKARGNHETHHRIFLAAIILATKYLYDVPLKNKHWAGFSRVFSCPEVNLMELQFLKLLDYDLEIKLDSIYCTLQRYNLTATRRPSICRPVGPACTYQHQNIPSSFAVNYANAPYGMNSCLPLSNAIASNRDAHLIASMMPKNVPIAAGKSRSRKMGGSSCSSMSMKSRESRGNVGGGGLPPSLCGKHGVATASNVSFGGIMKKTSSAGLSGLPASLPARIELSPGELEVFNEMISGYESSGPISAATPVAFAPSAASRPVSVPSYQLA